MPQNNQPFDIADDSALETAVRGETQYDDKRLSPDDLDALIQSAKRVLALRAEVTQFYDDRGTAVALFGLVCAKAKAAVENSPLQVKNVSGQDVTFRTSDGDSLQVEQYESMVQTGLSQSDKTDEAIQNIRFTHDYLNDSTQ